MTKLTSSFYLSIFLSFMSFFPLLPSTCRSEVKVDENYIKEVKKDWTFVYEKDGIHVFKKEVVNSGIMAFRGIGILKAPLPILFHVIRNIEKSYEWTPNLTAKKMAKEISLVEGITWNHNHVPWPGTDRDTVIHSKLIVDKEKNHFNIVSHSVELPNYPPNKDMVRADVHECHFIFKPVEGGVMLDLYAHIDPKGWLPSWFINMIQSKWPYNFMKNLDNYAQKGHHVPEPEFVKMVEDFENSQKK